MRKLSLLLGQMFFWSLAVGLPAVGLLAGALPASGLEPMVVQLGPVSSPVDDVGSRTDFAQVAAFADGFMVVWDQISPEPGGRLRWFDWAGHPLTPVLPLATSTGNLAVAGDGSFYMLEKWPGFGDTNLLVPPAFFWPLWVHRYDRSGQLLGSFRVGEGKHHSWAIEQERNGNLLVAWGGDLSDETLVWVRRYDPAGLPLTPPILVGQVGETPDRTEIAVGPDGGFTVFFEDYPNWWLPKKLYLRRFDSAGNALGPASEIPPGLQQETRVTTAANGNTAVLYTFYNQLYGQYFDPAGNLVKEFPIPNGLDVSWLASSVFITDGDLMVASSDTLDDTADGIQLHRLDRDGKPRGQKIRLSGPVTSAVNSYWPDVAAHGDRLVVAWTFNENQVRFQTFEATLFADGFESGGTGNWLLVN